MKPKQQKPSTLAPSKIKPSISHDFFESLLNQVDDESARLLQQQQDQPSSRSLHHANARQVQQKAHVKPENSPATHDLLPQIKMESASTSYSTLSDDFIEPLQNPSSTAHHHSPSRSATKFVGEEDEKMDEAQTEPNVTVKVLQPKLANRSVMAPSAPSVPSVPISSSSSLRQANLKIHTCKSENASLETNSNSFAYCPDLEQSTAPSIMRATSYSNENILQGGQMHMWWFDAQEGKNGVVYVFGKVLSFM